MRLAGLAVSVLLLTVTQIHAVLSRGNDVIAIAASGANSGGQGVTGGPQKNATVKGSPKPNPSVNGSQTRGKH